ncbi:hypothetical protein BGZ94_006473, partial [Podila epigama]
GFCGRSSLHCSHSTGCNAEKGACGVVVLDKQELPRVISYDELGQSTIHDLVNKLTTEGSHVAPDDVKRNITLSTILEKGVAERKQMLASRPEPSAHPIAQPVAHEQSKETAEYEPASKPKEVVSPNKTLQLQQSASTRNTVVSLGATGAAALGILFLAI